MGSLGHGGSAAGGLGERVADAFRQGKGRMGREHGGEPGPFDQRLIGRPANGRIIGIGSQKGLGQGSQYGFIGRQVDAANIAGEAIGARGEGQITQMADQRRDGIVIKPALIHVAGDCQGDEQDGIAERIFRDPRTQPRGEVQQFLGQIGSQTKGGDIGHIRSMARIVQCSKGNLAGIDTWPDAGWIAVCSSAATS